jgi:hypothetical protein
MFANGPFKGTIGILRLRNGKIFGKGISEMPVEFVLGNQVSYSGDQFSAVASS